jgi:hypothetical protein
MSLSRNRVSFGSLLLLSFYYMTSERKKRRDRCSRSLRTKWLRRVHELSLRKMILSKDVSVFQCQYFSYTFPRSKWMLQFRGATNDATQPSGRTRELNSLKKPLCLFIRPKLVTGCLQIVNPNYKQILTNRHRRTNCAELEIELSALALRGRCQGSLPLLERGHEEESCWQ